MSDLENTVSYLLPDEILHYDYNLNRNLLLPEESWLQNSWSFDHPLLVSFQIIT